MSEVAIKMLTKSTSHRSATSTSLATDLARQQASLGRVGIKAGSHESTTIYPRMGLGSGQHFASKGGYIVRFAEAGSDRLIGESEWIVP